MFKHIMNALTSEKLIWMFSFTESIEKQWQIVMIIEFFSFNLSNMNNLLKLKYCKKARVHVELELGIQVLTTVIFVLRCKLSAKQH